MKLNKQQQEITEKLEKLGGITKESIYSGLIVAAIVNVISLLLVSMFNITSKEIHDIYKRVVSMDEGLKEIAAQLGTEYGKWHEKKVPQSWLRETYENISKDKVSLGKDLDAMFNMLYEIDKLSISEKQAKERGWFGGIFKDFGSGAFDKYNEFVNKVFPDLVWMKIPTETELEMYSTKEDSLNEDEAKKLEEMKKLNEDSKELLKCVIDKLINENYERTKESIEDMSIPREEPRYGIEVERTSYIPTKD